MTWGLAPFTQHVSDTEIFFYSKEETTKPEMKIRP